MTHGDAVAPMRPGSTSLRTSRRQWSWHPEEEEMSENFGHKVEIEAKNKKSGKVVINYNTKDELESIISKLKN